VCVYSGCYSTNLIQERWCFLILKIGSFEVNWKVWIFYSWALWTIKLSLNFFRINWSWIRPHLQKRKCSSQLVLQVYKATKIMDVGRYLFKRSKQSYSNTIPDLALPNFCLTLIPLWNSITSPILRDSVSVSNRWKFNISSSIWNTSWPF
jgi:hypothetical protein